MNSSLRVPLFCSALFLVLSGNVAGQIRTIAGNVTDSVSGGPIAGVQVEALGSGGGLVAVARTDSRGRFELTGIGAGRYTIVFTRLGYAVRRVDGVAPGTPVLAVSMAATAVDIDPLVVSVSRTEQTALEAPASISVIDRREIEEAASFTPIDRVRDVAGVDMASKGLMQHTYTVRGEREVNAAALLTLLDHRYASVPSLRLNVSYLIPTTSDDIDRIEVLRGPSAALYGPNSDRGVVHIVTRSPLESQGTAVSIAGGERSVFHGSVRHAAVVGDRLGVKVSGEYFRGHDWEYTDTTEARKRAELVAAGADPDALLVGNRDFDIERVAGQGRVDWRVGDNTTLVLSGGWAQAMNALDLTAVGGTQVRDWRYQYLQAQVKSGRLFANVVFNASDAGETFQLRSGTPIVDESRAFAAQLQHGREVGGRHELLYGIDYHMTVPRTGGTIHGRNENADNLNELGAYLHSTTALSRRLNLVAALRLDYNDRINDLAVSPRAAVVFMPAPSHALRLTYNRAYNSPGAQDLFIDMVVDSFPGVPYAVRWRGIPKDGFNFRRDCSGLCMRSPFNPAGPWAFAPADATLLWPVIVAYLQSQGVDISAIPRPSALQVRTDLRTLNVATGDVDATTEAGVKDIEPARRTIANVLEVGYKGVIAERVLVGLDLHFTRVSDVASEPYAITPNVFFEASSLEQYLGAYLPAADAAQLAEDIAAIPLGTVSPEEAGDADVTLVEAQGGAYTVWGADLSIEAHVTPQVSVSGTYSWFSRDSIPNVGDIDAMILGVPKHKGSVSLGYRSERLGLGAEVRARAVTGFPVASGVYRGTVDSYAVVDASAGYVLPWKRNVRLSVDAQNVLNNMHQEYVGAALLGRLVTGRVHVTF